MQVSPGGVCPKMTIGIATQSKSEQPNFASLAKIPSFKISLNLFQFLDGLSGLSLSPVTGVSSAGAVNIPPV